MGARVKFWYHLGMNTYDQSWQLADLLEGTDVVYLRLEPEVPDFTVRASFKIVVWNLKNKVELDVTPDNVRQIVGLLDATVFDKEVIGKLFVWNLKPLCTYFHAFCPKFVSPQNNIIDLRVIEGFLGIRKNRPENLVEALNRTKIVVQFKDWHKTYKNIHQPLFLRVLPSIETTPLLNDRSRKCEYPYYEIEGQTNGRMNCLKKYANSYLPHNMGSEVREHLKPKGYGLRLCTSDFRHCEVTVLQWLSGDETLKEILDSGADLHVRIYEIVTGNSCDTENKRNLSKKMFLPVMYGCGPKGLAKNLDVSESVGEELCRRIYHSFPTATHYLKERQEEAKKGVVKDYFGRPRKFKEDESYKFRNTSVQAVAATVCQEKLIALWKSLNGVARLVFSIHDGYGMICDVPHAKQTYEVTKETLESESELCPGLKMKTEIKFGSRLSNMRVLWN